MSAGATPSDLMSEPSALAAFAFAAMASPAVFSVFVTPSFTRAKSVAALTLSSPVTYTQGSLPMSTKRSSAAVGVPGEHRRDCDARDFCASWVPLWMETRVEKGAAAEHGASPLIANWTLGVRMCQAA